MAARARALRLIGLPALVAVSVLLLAAVIFTFASVNDHNRAAAESIREDTLWAAYQLDRETGRMILAIHEYEETRTERFRDDMLQRFDILYSRIGLLSNGEYAARFRDTGELDGLLKEAKRQIESFTATFDKIAAEGHAETPLLVETRARAEILRAATEQLLAATNRRQVIQRVEDRDEALANYYTLGAGVLGLTISMGGVIALLWLQLRHIRRSERHLRQLSERYAEAAQLAEAGNRAKSAFLAAMSHEIRTPLNGVVGMVELLADSPLTPDQSRKLGTIRECSDALLAIINDVLDFSKLESGTIDLEDRAFPLRQLIESVVEIIQARAVDKGLALSFECPDVLVTGDEARIRQIVLNLAANAVKFTSAGSVRVVASVENRGISRSRLSVSVADTGIGISPEARSRLFREFSQVDASIRRRFGGTGLGLAICKKIAHAMGGEILVDSVEGQGSTFSLVVPVTRVTEAAPAAEGVRIDAPKPVSAGARVLVVEDNPTNQRVAGELLAKLGVLTEAAMNGEEAVARVAGNAYDLILMDMQMPVMDGLEATRRIRAAGFHDLPIIGLTANAFVSDREACLEAGMNDFLSKPATRAKLQTALSTWIKRREDETTPEAPAEASAPAPAAAELPSPVPDTVAAAATAVVEDGALFDGEQMASLRGELGDEMMDSLFESFWRDAEALATQIADALQAGQDEPFRRGLHTLKGIAQTVGFRAVAEAAIAAKDAYDAGGVVDLGPLSAALARTRAATSVPGWADHAPSEQAAAA